MPQPTLCGTPSSMPPAHSKPSSTCHLQQILACHNGQLYLTVVSAWTNAYEWQKNHKNSTKSNKAFLSQLVSQFNKVMVSCQWYINFRSSSSVCNKYIHTSMYDIQLDFRWMLISLMVSATMVSYNKHQEQIYYCIVGGYYVKRRTL